MSELWEHCNNKSRAVLIQLYWDQHGCYPDFYYAWTGEKRKPDIINAPLAAEEAEIAILKELKSNSDIKAKVK